MIGGILRDKAASIGDRPFLRFQDESISFREMDERSNRAANLLREVGVRRGDKVCLMIGNRPEFVELWFGLAKLGAIMVPMETSLSRNTASYIASHSDATVFAVEESAYLAIEEQLGKLPKIRKKIWIGSGGGGSPSGFLNYREAASSFPRTAGRFPATNPSDVMSIVYTPGTTGLPKGAMISQRNYCHAGRVWAEHVVRAGERDVFYTTQPLSQVQTQTLTVVGALVSGCRLVLGDGFVARTFFDAIRRHGATVFSLHEFDDRESDEAGSEAGRRGEPCPPGLRRRSSTGRWRGNSESGSVSKWWKGSNLPNAGGCVSPISARERRRGRSGNPYRPTK